MQIVGDALELAPDLRAALLEARCGSDAPLREEVERLLSVRTRAAELIPSIHAPLSALAATSPGMDGRLTRSAELASVIGQRVGAHEFVSILGQGGMGVVYRGRDTRLGRDVAIKTIPPSLSRDPTRLARFMREARVLASLSHPNIATVYGLEESGSENYLVMELIAGDTLAKRLSGGRAMSIPEALSVAAQIAAGLEAAHAAGVVHRDLKPGNVMFSADGNVKVLDFGLAREIGHSRITAGADEKTQSDITRDGSIMGTPRYMSPEQLRGESVDRRTDVFAFGCVLYECLTGRATFAGNSSAQITAAVLEREPDWSALPARTPPDVCRLLRRCLQKDLRQRLCDLGDARIELEDALLRREWAAAPAREAAPRRGWIVGGLAGSLVTVVVLVGLLFQRARPLAPESGPAQHFAIPFPNAQPQIDVAMLRVTLARDGSKLVVSASDGRQHRLWLRNKGEASLRPMEGTEGGRAPSISPDGQWIVYFLDGAMMKRHTGGGASYRISSLFGWWGNAFWSSSGIITYLPSWGRGLAQLSPEGGNPKFVTELRTDLKEFSHLSPFVLEDEKTALVTVWDGKAGLRIAAVNMATGQRHTVIENAWTPRLAKTPLGDYLLFCRANTIFAAPFDPGRAAITAPEVAIVDGVMTDHALFTACFDVANDGTIIYVPGAIFLEDSRLSWLGSDGSSTHPFNDDRRPFGDPQFSRDGKRLLVLLKGNEYRPHCYDLERGTFDALVSDSDVESAALSPDGSRLLYTSNREGPYGLWIRNLRDGSDQRIFKGTDDFQATVGWSPDGRHVVFSTVPPDSAYHDVWLIELESEKLIQFCSSPVEDRNPRFSPTGKWLAYVSDISGLREVYVRSFPDGQTTRQLTFGGADWPEWSPDGSTLYYRRQGMLWSVPISTTEGTTTGKPTLVYSGRFGQADYHMSDYAVAPDGRILLIEPSEKGPVVSHLNVVLNWHQLVAPRNGTR